MPKSFGKFIVCLLFCLISGWCYQQWQNARAARVDDARVKLTMHPSLTEVGVALKTFEADGAPLNDVEYAANLELALLWRDSQYQQAKHALESRSSLQLKFPSLGADDTRSLVEYACSDPGTVDSLRAGDLCLLEVIQNSDSASSGFSEKAFMPGILRLKECFAKYPPDSRIAGREVFRWDRLTICRLLSYWSMNGYRRSSMVVSGDSPFMSPYELRRRQNEVAERWCKLEDSMFQVAMGVPVDGERLKAEVMIDTKADLQGGPVGSQWRDQILKQARTVSPEIRTAVDSIDTASNPESLKLILKIAGPLL